MSSAADRRLAKLEASLTPQEAVLAWLAEARGMTFVDHARAIADAPVEASPLSVIGARVVAAVRAERKGQPRSEIERAALRAQGDAVFLFCLVVHLNRRAFEVAELEGLRAACAVFWMRSLLGERDKLPADEGDAQGRRDAWRNWHNLIDKLALDVRVEIAARTRLEQLYLEGHEVLFADAATEWGGYVASVDGLARLADNLRSVEPGKPPRQRTGAADALIDALADRLADDARVRAFEVLDDRERAVSIMERRLRR